MEHLKKKIAAADEDADGEAPVMAPPPKKELKGVGQLQTLLDDPVNGLNYQQKLALQREIQLREEVATTSGSRARSGQQVAQLNKKLGTAQAAFDTHNFEYEAAKNGHTFQDKLFQQMREVTLPLAQEKGYKDALLRTFKLMKEHIELNAAQVKAHQEHAEVEEAHETAMSAAEAKLKEADAIAKARAKEFAAAALRPDSGSHLSRNDSLALSQTSSLPSSGATGEEEDYSEMSSLPLE